MNAVSMEELDLLALTADCEQCGCWGQNSRPLEKQQSS